jgi:hypothetical protein
MSSIRSLADRRERGRTAALLQRVRRFLVASLGSSRDGVSSRTRVVLDAWWAMGPKEQSGAVAQRNWRNTLDICLNKDLLGRGETGPQRPKHKAATLSHRAQPVFAQGALSASPDLAWAEFSPVQFRGHAAQTQTTPPQNAIEAPRYHPRVPRCFSSTCP